MDHTTETQVFSETAIGNEERSDARLLQEKDARIAELTADKERLYRLLGQALANVQALQPSADIEPREGAGAVGARKALGTSKGQSNRGSHDAQMEDWWTRLKVWFFNA